VRSILLTRAVQQGSFGERATFGSLRGRGGGAAILAGQASIPLLLGAQHARYSRRAGGYELNERGVWEIRSRCTYATGPVLPEGAGVQRILLGSN
jgi:hypothetical protein